MNNYNEIDYSAINNISVHSTGATSLSPYLNFDPQYLTQGDGAEFVFAEESTKKRSWGERMFSSIGGSYMTGLTIGGVWGFMEGVRNPDGSTFKLRLNSVLNGCTRRGPFLANSLGVVALMYGLTNTAFEKVRGVEDDYNMAAAAVTTGMLFKSTGRRGGRKKRSLEGGPRAIAIAGGLGGGLAALYYAGNKLWNNRGQTWSTSQPNWA